MKEENPNQRIDKGLYFFSGEKTRKKAHRINGARPHFVKKRAFSYRKWGLAPFIPKASLSFPY